MTMPAMPNTHMADAAAKYAEKRPHIRRAPSLESEKRDPSHSLPGSQARVRHVEKR